MANRTRPFAAFEWMIAWRYLRARRAEGGVSVMTWISLIGITLAVFALVATLAVRSGYRAQFVDTILGANAHVAVFPVVHEGPEGRLVREITDYEAMARRIAKVPGVTSTSPLIYGQVMAAANGRNTGVQVYGIHFDDLKKIPLIDHPQKHMGDLANFPKGIAIGSGIAQDLGLVPGDTVKLISPEGAKTPFGVTPRVNAYKVEYIFTAGRYDIDQTRIYMPFKMAQDFFNRDGVADQIEVMVKHPEQVAQMEPAIRKAAVEPVQLWTWKDSSGAFLKALTVEDNVMFVILSILVLIASMNIVSGLIMLVKNKGRDIGILRTMGLTEGSVLRVFFICGASTGIAGTALGVILGCLFAIYINPIFSLVNYVAGGGVWNPEIYGLYQLPAKLEWPDVVKAASLSLSLSFIITIFPARRAARMNPVEALRYE
ncbi:ABC transporter substrate-binding protein [Defluviimonas sp. 20V17]|uniref:ABC transporter substrate-binding protein n=1 Tax=Allgaiera indica TaxID=765699 RepID=A0AAN4UUV0_9RHOB|nr:lipoprotein-releasing ABC transporter permease subunit [Allgaiera indica]KDB04886.1 ABC transporter substrate-binding protein [Defluviimonas sp. 20V17]GHE05582.1 ABC transporter substrate-binding protein [Allgaiera indica]SDX77466.1 lipoprotein-releasing system permease protein [Allgaiera indica]